MFHWSTFCERHSCEHPLKIKRYTYHPHVIVTHKTESLHNMLLVTRVYSAFSSSIHKSRMEKSHHYIVGPSILCLSKIRRVYIMVLSGHVSIIANFNMSLLNDEHNTLASLQYSMTGMCMYG